MILRVGTRGSRLSVLQTEGVLREMQAANKGVEFGVKIIKTLGDREQERPLFAIDGMGVFEKEIDQAIVNGEVDLAVHSLKDVPVLGMPEITIAAIPRRIHRHDVLISRGGVPLAELPSGARVGTGSLRRLAQIRYLRPDLDVRPIRGNVDTRVRKVKSGELDAVVVAEAGVERLGMGGEVAERLPLEHFPTAAGQGALAVVARRDRQDVIIVAQAVDDPLTRAEVTAERSLIRHLGGGCRVPVGAVGVAQGGRLSLQGHIFSLDCRKKISSAAEGALSDADVLGERVAMDLIGQGAKDFVNEWRRREWYGENRE
ncbi:MAG: hydroxymethylbilane synthase [Candidatus Verstraetearchaeota archaeon]|nr:hydroxymethylbilane synthase [Candidatus Verstraetearchaeota archaeon]